VREVFDIGAKDKAELKRSDWLKFDGSLFGGGGDRTCDFEQNVLFRIFIAAVVRGSLARAQWLSVLDNGVA
jgi:hypothetical protein